MSELQITELEMVAALRRGANGIIENLESGLASFRAVLTRLRKAG